MADYSESCPLFNSGVGEILTLPRLRGGTSTTTKLVDNLVLGHVKTVKGAQISWDTMGSTTCNCVAYLCKNSTTTVVATLALSSTNDIGKFYSGTISTTNMDFEATDILIAKMATKAKQASNIDIVVKTENQ